MDTAQIPPELEALVKARLIALAKTLVTRLLVGLTAAGAGVPVGMAVQSSRQSDPAAVVEPAKATPAAPACKCQPAPKGQTTTSLPPK